MSFRLSLLLEIMAVICCVHRLYNRKVNFDLATIALYLSCIVIFDLENIYKLGFFYTALAYGLVVVYCVRKYDDSLFGAVSSVFMAMILIAIMQFSFTVFLDLFFDISEAGRAVITNILVLGSCITGLKKCRIHRLRMHQKKANTILLLLLGFLICLISLMRLQQRVLKEIYVGLFIFAVPMAVLLLLLAGKWIMTQHEKDDMEKELQTMKSMQKKYEELVRAVRLRQHEYKNHMAAIFATHYTYKSYDKLVNAQAKYCGRLSQENRHNDLLLLGDAVLIGFLYDKFCEMEKDGVEVAYSIKGKLEKSIVPTYYLIEMIGILLDNASCAVQKADPNGAVQFCFEEDEGALRFKISNPFPYTRYDDIETWFQMGKSTKGKERGLGLYHLRCLCEEWSCDILCRNMAADMENWIEFILTVSKADKK